MSVFMLLLTTSDFQDVNNERGCDSETGYCSYFSGVYLQGKQFLFLDMLIKNVAAESVLNL